MLRERGGENVDLRQSPAEAGEEAAPTLHNLPVLKLAIVEHSAPPAEGAEGDKEAAAALKNLPADVGVSEGIKLALKSLAK